MRLNDATTAIRAGVLGAAVVAAGLLAPAQATATGVPGPTGLQVSEVKSTSFTLSWSQPQDTRGLYGYSVRDLDNPSVNNQIGWSFTTSATVEANPATTYNVAVRTSYINHPDGVAESEPSNAVTVTTPPDTEPPETPAALRVLRKTATSVGFHKSLANDNVGTRAPDYLIEVDGGARFVPVTKNQSSWGVSGLATNATHTFRVKAIDAAGNESGWSEPVSASIEDEPPSVPSNIRVEDGLAVWDPSTDNAGAVRYEVFIDGDFRISGVSQPRDDFGFWLEVAEAFGPGEHRFTVEAIDSSQNRSGPSAAFIVSGR
jgi:hypothetical protein